LRVDDLGGRIYSRGFRVQGSGFRVQGSGSRVCFLGSRVTQIDLRARIRGRRLSFFDQKRLPTGAAGGFRRPGEIRLCGLPPLKRPSFWACPLHFSSFVYRGSSPGSQAMGLALLAAAQRAPRPPPGPGCLAQPDPLEKKWRGNILHFPS